MDPRLLHQDLSRLILELYRIARETPFAAFQPRALELVGGVISFDSAWWGNASAVPQQLHRMYLFNCDQALVDDYPPYMEEDFFRVALIADPGRSINMADLTSRQKYARSRLYRELGRRYRIEWSLGTLLIEPVSSLYEFLTLWRHDPKRPFSEAERQVKEFLMPHLAEAQRQNRLFHAMGWYRALHNTAWAIADQKGYLREISASFVHMLRQEWPDWGGSALLPAPLLGALFSAGTFQGARLNVTIAEVEGLRFLNARPRPVDPLSARERQVANLYATGSSHARIAETLRLSPATVRNHVARAYRKLAVSNKVELARRLAENTG